MSSLDNIPTTWARRSIHRTLRSRNPKWFGRSSFRHAQLVGRFTSLQSRDLSGRTALGDPGLGPVPSSDFYHCWQTDTCLPVPEKPLCPSPVPQMYSICRAWSALSVSMRRFECQWRAKIAAAAAGSHRVTYTRWLLPRSTKLWGAKNPTGASLAPHLWLIRVEGS